MVKSIQEIVSDVSVPGYNLVRSLLPLDSRSGIKIQRHFPTNDSKSMTHDEIEQTLALHNQRMSNIDARLDRVSDKLDQIAEQQDANMQQIAANTEGLVMLRLQTEANTEGIRQLRILMEEYFRRGL